MNQIITPDNSVRTGTTDTNTVYTVALEYDNRITMIEGVYNHQEMAIDAAQDYADDILPSVTGQTADGESGLLWAIKSGDREAVTVTRHGVQ